MRKNTKFTLAIFAGVVKIWSERSDSTTFCADIIGIGLIENEGCQRLTVIFHVAFELEGREAWRSTTPVVLEHPSIHDSRRFSPSFCEDK